MKKVYLMILGIVLLAGCTTGRSAYSSQGSKKTYTSISWNTLERYFWLESTYTDLQKENIVDNNKGKWINGTGIIKGVDKSIWDTYYVTLRDPTNEYAFMFVTLYFDDDYSEQLLSLSEHDQISFTCRIKSSLMGLNLDKCEFI